MGRTTTYSTQQPFVADPHSLTRNNGRQVDWDYITALYQSTAETIQTSSAANANATTLAVDALPVPILAGTILNFGTYAPVTVTLTAQTTAGGTSLAVSALSGPIPANTFLDFGVELARVTTAAAAGATSLTIDAAETDIESGDSATFNGGTIQARVTANAAAGATSLTVDELQFGIANDAQATFGGTGKKKINAGTVMCALSSGKVVPRAIRPGSETSIGLIETDAQEDDRSAALSGYGIIVGGVVYENLLPDAGGGSTISSTYKTELQTAGVGTGFSFQAYSDDRGS